MKIKFAYGLIFLLSVGLFACSSDNKQQAQSNVLRIVIGPPQTIDPHQVTGVPGVKVGMALSESLLQYNYATLTVEPAAAEAWSISQDGLTYTFDLRKSARWSNGEPVTAKDFVYSWQRLLAPALGNQYATDFYMVKNAEAYNRGDLKDASQLGVKAVSDYQLVIELEQPDPLFLKRVSDLHTAPVHQATVEKFGAMDDPTNAWIKAGNYVGNGPFVLKKWELNQNIEVIKNPYYWDEGNILLDAITFFPNDSEIGAERQFRTGQVDLVYMNRIPSEKIATYQKENPDVLRLVSTYSVYYYTFNTEKAPFDQVDVRKAFALAIDKEAIVKQVTKAGEPPAYSLNPPSTNYSPPQMPKFDPAKAKQLLAKAGYPDGKGLPPVTLTYNTSENHQKLAVAIQQMWKQYLGVDVQLENKEWKVFLTDLRSGDFQVARLGSVSGIADPSDFLDSYETGHGMNRSRWSNPEFDKLITKAKVTMDEELRLSTYKQAESLFLQDQPIAPIFFYTDSFLISPEVKGFDFNIVSLPKYKGVYLERGQDK